jgi:ferredoxin-NADP reductase
MLYATEIESIRTKYPRVKVVITLTESTPTDWQGYSRRIDMDMFKRELGGLMGNSASVYVCGPTKFVEAAAGILIDIGFPAETIKTERFGG